MQNSITCYDNFVLKVINFSNANRHLEKNERVAGEHQQMANHFQRQHKFSAALFTLGQKA